MLGWLLALVPLHLKFAKACDTQGSEPDSALPGAKSEAPSGFGSLPMIAASSGGDWLMEQPQTLQCRRSGATSVPLECVWMIARFLARTSRRDSVLQCSVKLLESSTDLNTRPTIEAILDTGVPGGRRRSTCAGLAFCGG